MWELTINELYALWREISWLYKALWINWNKDIFNKLTLKRLQYLDIKNQLIENWTLKNEKITQSEKQFVVNEWIKLWIVK